MTKQISTIILAAGASTRMPGTIKQLLPWRKTTLLGNAIEQAKPVSSKVYVVLGANAKHISESMEITANVVHNPDWNTGMGSSIAFGMNEVMKSDEIPQAVLLMLADQPLIDSSYLTALKTKFFAGTNKIVATEYENGLGVPAIFHVSLFEELSRLDQKFGARKIIAKYKKDCISIPSMDKSIDIDTIDEYNYIIEKQDINNENI
ncbi:nucleotidyltransferase family protein [Flagellimonas algicola]|uniref:Nucleotidyltransferase family protein n=1 Tax=Flagellimonas algicola TaxID=2583815 RepID=A0ABY2WNY1_9FLAO|nr:nucleotidyltransferase family protein [Allomuricauda algicola]TMU56452.1 nucleotidyltransferase family protein [Allomuricauda algicola]